MSMNNADNYIYGGNNLTQQRISVLQREADITKTKIDNV